jgi:Clp amino terminal domain, pathogenicity island component
VTIDEKILEDARKARQALVDLESQAAHARVDFHHAIKKLHAARGSLREIAEALDLSHQRVHQIVEDAPDRRGALVVPPWVKRSRRVDARHAKFLARLNKDAQHIIMVDAQDEAEQLKHGYVGTEHLMLALIRSGATAGVELDIEAARSDVVSRVGEGGVASRGRRPFTAQAKLAIDRALKAATARNERQLTADDLLLAVVSGEGTGGEALQALGVTPERVREHLRR